MQTINNFLRYILLNFFDSSKSILKLSYCILIKKIEILTYWNMKQCKS